MGVGGIIREIGSSDPKSAGPPELGQSDEFPRFR